MEFIYEGMVFPKDDLLSVPEKDRHSNLNWRAMKNCFEEVIIKNPEALQ
jgi:hypothetical protein